MKKTWKNDIEFNQQWGDLATYNAEVSRGIVHTENYKSLMTEKQDKYNREVLDFK